MTGPVDGRRIVYGRKVTFRGTLIDTTTSQPIANAAVLVVTNLDTFRVRTNAAGGWRVTRSKAILRDISWHAVYLGSDTEAPAATPTRRIYVTPHLGLTIQLPFRNGHYIAGPGGVHGLRPVAAGHGRRGGHAAGPARRRAVGDRRVEPRRRRRPVRGRRDLGCARRGTALRWAYLGGSFRRWLPTHSRAVTVVAP